jgi:methyl-accepting chemotaxis protein
MLLAIFAGLGVSTAIYALVVVFSLRAHILAMAGFIRGGARPGIQRNDELWVLAEQIERSMSLEKLLARLKVETERLHAGFAGLAVEQAETAASAKHHAQMLEDTRRTVLSIEQNVKRIAENAGSSLGAAAQGGEVLERSLERIRRGIEGARLLEESASRIEEAVSLIGDLADQTELLSLNAAIEAARAGESGRGFTVVAQQVRKLADKSAKAVSDISELVHTVLEGVRRMGFDAKESYEAASGFRKEMETISKSIRGIVDIAGSASEEAGRTNKIFAAMNRLVSNSSRAPRDLSAAGSALRDHVDRLARIASEMAPQLAIAPVEESLRVIEAAQPGPPVAATPAADQGDDVEELETVDE